MPRTYLTAMERIAARTSYEDRGYATPCRIWTGGKHERGYGHITADDGKRTATHRVTYEALVGPIPAGLELDHLCRQTDCCEVTHLDAVTHAENCRRGVAGEIARQRAASITHCPKGHEYTPENTTMRPHFKSGHMCRFCKQCARDWSNRNHARKRAARLAASAAACFALLVLPAIAGAGTNGAAPKRAALPTGPCNADHILDIEIIDGVLYECGCNKRLFVPDDCGWEEITSQAEDPTLYRRVIKRALARHHRVIRIYAKPAIA